MFWTVLDAVFIVFKNMMLVSGTFRFNILECFEVFGGNMCKSSNSKSGTDFSMFIRFFNIEFCEIESSLFISSSLLISTKSSFSRVEIFNSSSSDVFLR